MSNGEYALILRKVEFGDSDLVLTFLGIHRGKFSALAKHAQSSKRRFGGVLEPYTVLNVHATQKSTGMALLDEASVVEQYEQIAADYPRLVAAAYATELVREVCAEDVNAGETFKLLIRFYQWLNSHDVVELAIRLFEHRLLSIHGLMPPWSHCQRCGVEGQSSGQEAGKPHFWMLDAVEGGFFCGECGHADANMRISEAMRSEFLMALSRGSKDSAWEVEKLAGLRRVFRAWLGRVMETNLRSRDALDDFFGGASPKG